MTVPVVWRAGDRPGAGAGDDSDDSGFLLIEAVVAIAVVAVVMSAIMALLVTVTRNTTEQRNASVAAQIALGALDRARGAGAAGTIAGRDTASTTAQFTRTPADVDWPAGSALVSGWLTEMTPATDTVAPSGAGATATFPTQARHQLLNGVDYRINYFVGSCWRPASASDCTRVRPADGIGYVRVVVAVTWTARGCPAVGCGYVGATLLHGGAEPIFNVNQDPPPAPRLRAVPAQLTRLGTAVTGLTGVTGCASPCPVATTDGVPPYVFTVTGLPTGLAADAGGLITGTPTTAGSYPVRVRVLDAFLGADELTFTWTVAASLPAPTLTNPGPQSTSASRTATLALTYTCADTPCVFTLDASTAARLSINATTGAVAAGSGAVRGGPYPVTVTVTDAAGAKATATFTWSRT